jgi:hypothetical protein
MKTLFKTSDLIKWLYNIDCPITAEAIKKRAAGAEFIDSKLVHYDIIPELYEELKFELNAYTYKN